MLFPISIMSDKKPPVDIYSWWIDLLVSHNIRFERGFQESESPPIAAIEQTIEAVHLFYERHYFFGMDFSSGSPILYTFLPDQSVELAESERKELCWKLEHDLNSGLGKRDRKKFEKYFVLPLKAGFETRNFDGKEYGGVKVSLPVKNEAIFNRKYLNPEALFEWRSKVFSKLNRFFQQN